MSREDRIGMSAYTVARLRQERDQFVAQRSAWRCYKTIETITEILLFLCFAGWENKAIAFGRAKSDVATVNAVYSNE